jgi:inorganic pyrophosphatase
VSASTNLTRLDAWNAETGGCNVIIETIQGERNKFKYDPKLGIFVLCKVLPCGAVFPFDFGFIPSTLGDDGDPLDVLVLMDAPCFPGCQIPSRLIGVLEAEQTEDGKTERNDRLIAVAEQSHDHQDVRSIHDLNKHLLEEVEHFFVSYDEMAGKLFAPIAWHGPNRARKLIKKGIEKADPRRKKHDNGKPSKNGHSKVRKS